jgi:predicted ATPase
MKLKTVTLRGYKSISVLEDFELRNLNVLIGANGAGKSNFIGIFKLLGVCNLNCVTAL